MNPNLTRLRPVLVQNFNGTLSAFAENLNALWVTEILQGRSGRHQKEENQVIKLYNSVYICSQQCK